MNEEIKKPADEKPKNNKFYNFFGNLNQVVQPLAAAVVVIGGLAAISPYLIAVIASSFDGFTWTPPDFKIFYYEVMKWQILIGIVFAITAFLFANIKAAQNTRKRDEEIRQQDKDDQDDALKVKQKSLAAAFYAELTIIKASAVSYQKWTEETRKANEGKEEWSIPFEVLDKFDLGHQTVLNPMLLKLAYCPTVFLEK